METGSDMIDVSPLRSGGFRPAIATVVIITGCRGRPTGVERTSNPNRLTQSRYSASATPQTGTRVSGAWICRDSRIFFQRLKLSSYRYS